MESRKKKERGEGNCGSFVSAKEPAISRGGARVIRRRRKKIRPRSFRARGLAATVYLQIHPRERGTTARQNEGVVGSRGFRGGEEGEGRGESARTDGERAMDQEA